MSRFAGPSLNRRGKIGNGTREVPLGTLSPGREGSGTRLGIRKQRSLARLKERLARDYNTEGP